MKFAACLLLLVNAVFVLEKVGCLCNQLSRSDFDPQLQLPEHASTRQGRSSRAVPGQTRQTGQGRSSSDQTFEDEIANWDKAQGVKRAWQQRPQQGAKCVHRVRTQTACGEVCSCYKGRWLCCRQRKEFSRMTSKEVERYIHAYVTVTTKQPYKKIYDAMVAKHERLFDQAIHKWPQFWPWHRYFILKLENLLRRVDCKVTLSYWDFTLHWRRPLESKMWGSRHLGGNGHQPDDCVRSGPFRRGSWHVTPSAGGGCLKRHFTGKLISPKVLTYSLYYFKTPSQLRTFEKIVSVYMHSGVHMALGGIMATNQSANEPSFWMLHSFADKLWAAWQSRGQRFKVTPYAGMRHTVLSEQDAGESFTVADMYDTEHLPGHVCVHYAAEMSEKTALATSRLLGLAAPTRTPRNLSPTKLHSLLSGMSREERKQMAEMKKELHESDKYYR